jgi:hypothetical protein
MATTDVLEITLLETGDEQKEVGSNDADKRTAHASHDLVDLTVTGSPHNVTATEWLDNFVLRLIGTPASDFTLVLPDKQKAGRIINTTGKTATVDTSSGSTLTPTIPDGRSLDIYNRGTELEPGPADAGGTGASRTRSKVFPVTVMRPTVTAGCGAEATAETTAGNPDMTYLPFDQTTEEHAQWKWKPPKAWDLGTVTFRVHDSFAGTQGAGLDGRAWGLRAVARGHDDPLDVAFGTEVVVVIDHATAEDLAISAESAAVTIGGTPAEGDTVFWQISRKTGDAGDDLDLDARLLAVEITWTEDKADDS